jgi:hypothetical protein
MLLPPSARRNVSTREAITVTPGLDKLSRQKLGQEPGDGAQLVGIDADTPRIAFGNLLLVAALVGRGAHDACSCWTLPGPWFRSIDGMTCSNREWRLIVFS